jgi:hypothetical protein
MSAATTLRIRAGGPEHDAGASWSLARWTWAIDGGERLLLVERNRRIVGNSVLSVA